MSDIKMVMQYTNSQCEWLKENLIPTAPFKITYKIEKIYGMIEWSDIKSVTKIIIIGNTSAYARAYNNNRGREFGHAELEHSMGYNERGCCWFVYNSVYEV